MADDYYKKKDAKRKQFSKDVKHGMSKGKSQKQAVAYAYGKQETREKK